MVSRFPLVGPLAKSMYEAPVTRALERYSLWAAIALVALTIWCAPFTVLSNERATARATLTTRENDRKISEAGYQSKIREQEVRIADLKQETQQVRADLTREIENLQAEKRTLLGAVVKPPPVPLVPVDLRAITEHFSPTEFPDRPYRTVVTIQTNRRMQPTRVRVVFDGPISQIPTHRMLQGVTSWQLVGAGVFTDPGGKVVDGNTFEVGFSSPAFTPQGPLILTVLSKERVNVVRVER